MKKTLILFVLLLSLSAFADEEKIYRDAAVDNAVICNNDGSLTIERQAILAQFHKYKEAKANGDYNGMFKYALRTSIQGWVRNNEAYFVYLHNGGVSGFNTTTKEDATKALTLLGEARMLADKAEVVGQNVQELRKAILSNTKCAKEILAIFAKKEAKEKK